MPSKTAEAMIEAARELSEACSRLKFKAPVTHIYNPLVYAWAAHEKYLTRCAASRKRVILMGMNPGPFGMAQTAVPFGEIDAVRDWIGINVPVDKPVKEHPKRPIEGFECKRSEVSGRRLWGLFREEFPSSSEFFRDHFVLNYCPLAFMEESGRNRTPDKLPTPELAALTKVCDRHLKKVIEILEPDWFVGVGGYAEDCAKRVIGPVDTPSIGRILHPSPASPAANRDWAGTARKQLLEQGIW